MVCGRFGPDRKNPAKGAREAEERGGYAAATAEGHLVEQKIVGRDVGTAREKGKTN